MNKLTAIIINPISGKGNGKRFFEENKSLFNMYANVNIYLTKKPKHATEITEKLGNKYDRVIVCGGDGTLHEVINGLSLSPDILLGLIPIGSGNDFSLSFHNKKGTSKKLLEYYLSSNPKIRKIDFANIDIKDTEGKIFHKRMINSFGAGFDAKVAYYNQTNKILSGTLSYITAILKALFEFSHIDYKLTLDETKQLDGNALFCAIGNGQSIGGGLYLMPKAKLDDGYLNLSIVKIKSRLKLMILLPKAISNLLDNSKELEQYKFSNLKLKLLTPFFLHIDGEIITDKAEEITINIAEQKLNFMCNFKSDN